MDDPGIGDQTKGRFEKEIYRDANGQKLTREDGKAGTVEGTPRGSRTAGSLRRKSRTSLRQGIFGKSINIGHGMEETTPRARTWCNSSSDSAASTKRNSSQATPSLASTDDELAVSNASNSVHLSRLAAVQSPTVPKLADEWDYGETEWWGWIILIATWIIFVVVMGSCLGVWSWAWDVGETPYAPPELEDDPTLPITGYYPTLMVCTAVMAWVWVVVAWVGMKYFRHAKMVSDDG